MRDMMAAPFMNPSHRVQVERFQHMLHLSAQVQAFRSALQRTGLPLHVQLPEPLSITEEGPVVHTLSIPARLPYLQQQLFMHMRLRAGTGRATQFPDPVPTQLRNAQHHPFLRVAMLLPLLVRHLVQPSIIRDVVYLVHVPLVVL